MSNTNLTPQQKIRQVRAHLANPIQVEYLSWLTEGYWIDLALEAGAIVETNGMYYRAENAPLVFTAGETTDVTPVNQPETLPISSPVAHALAHLQATNDHYFHTCNFWEQLPDPTVQDAIREVFGAKAPTPLTSEDKALAAKNTCELHARIAQEIREDLAELEAAGIESPKPEFPELPDLKLVNADRVWQDGYLLYVGNRSACVLAAEWFPGAGVKKNSADGRSWRLMITIGQLEKSKETQQGFDPASIIATYYQKQASTQQQVA